LQSAVEEIQAVLDALQGGPKLGRMNADLKTLGDLSNLIAPGLGRDS